jgi:hypothetical protein
MDNYLQQGITAAKAGDKPRAFDLLIRASQSPVTSEQAWLWLSGVVDDDSERLFCLESVLRINSNNVAAQRGSTMLRQKGIFPAVPIYPEPKKGTPTQDYSPKQAPSTKSPQVNPVASTRTVMTSAPAVSSASHQQASYETDWKKQELSGLFEYAAMELASNKSHPVVEKLLVNRGASLETAKAIVKDAQYAVKKLRREKYKKRMTRGLLWTIAGVVITCGTLAFADSLGGRYVLFYGAIIFGFIDFVVGLIGWLVNG